MDKPILALETKHTFVWVIKSPHVRAILDFLARPTTDQIKELADNLNERLELHMKRVSTLLREFQEGLDLLAADEAQDDERDARNTATIAELRAIIDELNSRPTLKDEDRTRLEAMVSELARRTGNVETENPEDVNDDGSAQVPPANPPTGFDPNPEPNPNPANPPVPTDPATGVPADQPGGIGPDGNTPTDAVDGESADDSK